MMNKSIDIAHLVRIISVAIDKNDEFVALHEPCFEGNEWNYVKECIDTRWVSSVGKYVDLFEQKLAEYTGVKRAVAVVNGTAALHICLKLAGVGQNDEVIAPTLTFIATANAIRYCGAIPHFADVEETTLGLDADKLDEYLSEIAIVEGEVCVNRYTGRKIKAVVPMHTFGHPVDLDRLTEVCQRYNIVLIEDAAESLGSYYKGKHTGHWGLLSAISFNGNKIVTTGGGGAILTNDDTLADRAKHLTTTAKVKHPWDFVHDEVGFNYRMPNINAALGCAQIEQLPRFVEKKRQLAQTYRKALQNVEGLRFFIEPANCKSNYWLNCLLLDETYSHCKNEFLQRTNDSGIMTRPVWKLMHKLSMFKDCPKMDTSVAESIEGRLINLPSSVFLGE